MDVGRAQRVIRSGERQRAATPANGVSRPVRVSAANAPFRGEVAPLK
jgi:hypothetical protein